MTVLEELYKHLEVEDPIFWNAQMILDWAKENKQKFLDKEQEQLSKAWQDGASEAQSDAAKEIEKNYTPRIRPLLME
jgi:adenylate kinase